LNAAQAFSVLPKPALWSASPHEHFRLLAACVTSDRLGDEAIVGAELRPTTAHPRS
jgi:hypothetical protein